jgi:hypothetical protein
MVLAQVKKQQIQISISKLLNTLFSFFILVVYIARRTRTRYRTRVKRVYSRSRSGGGKIKNIIDGALAGAVGEFAQKYAGAYGHPIGALGIGFWRKNNVLTTTGARELGAMLVNQMGFGSGAGGVYD